MDESPAPPAGTGIIHVTKRENFENRIIPGACFALIANGTEITATCDQQEGDMSPEPGVIGLQAPVGTYVLHETTAPDGYEPGSDTEVVIAAGTPVSVDVINHLAKTTDTLVIHKVDSAGTPIGDACFDIVGADETVESVCDNDPSDDAPEIGVIRVETNAGDYVLRETPPAGYSPTEVAVNVIRGSGANVEVVNQAATPASGPGVFVAYIVESDGETPFGAVCLTLSGVSFYSACDNGEGDVDPTEGTIEIDAILPGEYALTSRAPDDWSETAPLPTVVISESSVDPITLTFQPADPEPTTEGSGPGNGVVVVSTTLEDGVTPMTGVCLRLVGPTTLEICDNDDGDVEPTDGVIELDAVPAGDYTADIGSLEGYEPASQVPGIRVDSEQVSAVSLSFRRSEAQVETGAALVQAVLDDGVSPLPGVCLTMNGPTTLTVCDNSEGDTNAAEGLIEFQAIPVGAYTVEPAEFEGYEVESEVPTALNVESENPGSVTITYRQIVATGTVLVSIVDAVDGASALPGACLDLSGNEETRSICDNDENDRDEILGSDAAPGIIAFADLSPGEYTLHQSRPPEGYDPAADQTVSITSGETAALTVANNAAAPVVGALQVFLTDESGNLVPGACVSLLPELGDGNSSSVDICDSDGGDGAADGSIVFADLQTGLYQVSETESPTGYQKADPVQAEIPAEGGTVQVSIVHRIAAGSIAIVTTGPEGEIVPNACYTNIAPDGVAADGCDDDSDGAVIFEGLTPGNYIVRQLALPAAYSVGEQTEQPVSVRTDEQASVGFSVAAAIPATASLLITVADDSGQPIGGACFDVTGQQSIRVCDNGENDADGISASILVENLQPGEYTVTETQTPDGHGTADPQTVLLDPAATPTSLTFVNPVEPSGIALSTAAVYTDDAGRLWLLRPGDTQPVRLDADDRPFDPSIDPVSSYDHAQIAFLVSNAQQPAANMVWINVQDLTPGAVDFSGIGIPTSLTWVTGRNDLLLVAVQQASGLTNLFYLNTTTFDVIGPIFPAELEPLTIDAIIPSPATTLVALQTTRSDGNTDIWLVDSSDPAGPNLVNAGPNQGNDQDVFVGWSPSGDTLLVRSGPDASMLYLTNRSATPVQLGANPIYQGDSHAGTAPSWSPDSTLVAYFDNDPAAGGQFHIVRTDGSPLCDPLANVQSAVWTPRGPQIWSLMNVPGSPQSLTVINADCSQQQLTTFNDPVDRLHWSPDGRSLAIVNYGEEESRLILFDGDSLMPIDMAKANVAFVDTLSWSPGGETLAILAGGLAVAVWVVQPGSDAPAPIDGSVVPEGANHIVDVWWP